MKADLGGGAACLAGFEAACALGGGELSALHCVLCIAENAIGNDALRCDDIIKFFGGRTCEINNTDAEGRLVLADGVAHATAPDVLPGKRVDIVVDMATLTGAQMVATARTMPPSSQILRTWKGRPSSRAGGRATSCTRCRSRPSFIEVNLRPKWPTRRTRSRTA